MMMMPSVCPSGGRGEYIHDTLSRGFEAQIQEAFQGPELTMGLLRSRSFGSWSSAPASHPTFVKPNYGAAPVLLGEARAAHLAASDCVIDLHEMEEMEEEGLDSALKLAERQVTLLKAAQAERMAKSEAEETAQRLANRLRDLQIKLAKQTQDRQKAEAALEEERGRREAVEAAKQTALEAEQAATQAVASVNEAMAAAVATADEACKEVERLKASCAELRARNEELEERARQSAPTEPEPQRKGAQPVSFRKLVLTRISPGGSKANAGGSSSAPSPAHSSPSDAKHPNSPMISPSSFHSSPGAAIASPRRPSPVAQSIKVAMSWMAAQEEEKMQERRVAFAPPASEAIVTEASPKEGAIDDPAPEPELPCAQPLRRVNSFTRI